jgi:uncharacterized membrane protein
VDIVEIGLLVLSGVLVVGGGAVAIASGRTDTRDLDEWMEAGLISREQASALRAHRAAALELDRRERAAMALAILGAAACAAGVVLFFAANWSDIPKVVRLFILIAGIVALYGAGFWLLEVRRAYHNVGQGFVFVGAILFGVSLFLVGQMYNVDTHDPFGFLIWAAGALATALFFRSKPAAGLFALALEAWVIHELVDSDEGYETVAFIPLALALYGLALYAAGTAGTPWLERLRLAGAFRVVGFGIAAVMVFALSFRYTHVTTDRRPHDLALWVILVSAGIAVAGGVALVARSRPLPRRLEALLVLAATTLVLLAVFVPEGSREEPFFGQDAKVYPLLFAALVVVVAAGAIVAGSLREELWLASAGVLLGAATILGHFVDTAWNRLPRSAVYLAVGVLALAAAAALARAGPWRKVRLT